MKGRTKLFRRIRLAALALTAAAALSNTPSGAAKAAELKIGLTTITSSADPHFYDIGPNNSARQHVYEALFIRTNEMQFKPSLAESWKIVDNTT